VDEGRAGQPEGMTYPVSLRMQNRLAVVVGGGSAAAQRVAGLRVAGAEVLVIAPELSPALADLASRGLIAVRRRGYLATDLDGAWLALGCTNQAQVDAAVAADAERQRIWCVGADEAVVATASVPGRLPAGAAGRPRRILVLGGARSGKSVNAEAMLADHGPVDYIATGPAPGAGDPEWDARIRDHRRRRPAHWRTAETLDVDRALAAPQACAPVLIDCLSTWLARVMEDCGLWTGDPGADLKLAARLDGLIAAWQATRRYVVAVSNEVGSGVVPATLSGQRFRDELGVLNARIAAECHEVWLCTAGIARRLR